MQYLIFAALLLPNSIFCARLIWDKNAIPFPATGPIPNTLNISLPNLGLIFPGTKWCGPGNIAHNDTDFGTFKKTDMCCQKHDHCPDIIEGLRIHHGLLNPTIFTRLHCDCDKSFRQCLHTAKDEISDLVGTIYFDVYTTKCFEEQPPIIDCKNYSKSKIFGKRCIEYTYDTSKEKFHQWFDIPFY